MCSTTLANTTLVAIDDEDVSSTTFNHRPITNQLVSPKSSRRKASTSSKINIDYLSFVRESYKDKGLKDETIELLMNSWREKTKLQYNVYLKRWFEFSRESIENPLRPTLHDGMEFLTYLFSQGYSHGQISRARSAISVLIDQVNDISFGRHPLVKRLMKCIFEARPIFPKYRTVWSVNIVFNYFRTLDQPKNLSMGLLGKKLALLMCLIAGGQRCQTLHAIDIRDIKFVEDKCVIPIYEKLKQTKPGVHMKPMEFKLFTSDPKLCVINNLTLSYLGGG